MTFLGTHACIVTQYSSTTSTVVQPSRNAGPTTDSSHVSKKMGSVFGKTGVEESSFKLLMRSRGNFQYEVREYGSRFAVETAMNEENSAFMTLAKFIGVMGSPENRGDSSGSDPVPIAMTAPVVKTSPARESQVMQFFLPAKFDSFDKIPKPTSSEVTIKKVPAETGAIHQFSGSFSDEISREKVKRLANQLREDGVEEMSDDFALDNFQWFGYNPPFTLPPFRRNEVWIPLSQQQVSQLGQSLGNAPN